MTIGAVPGYYDIRTILAHEAGHWWGMDDLPVEASGNMLMYAYGFANYVKINQGLGDYLGQRQLYLGY